MKKEAALDFPAEKFISKEIVETDRGPLNRISINFYSLSDEDRKDLGIQPSGFFTEPIEIYYAMANNIRCNCLNDWNRYFFYS